RRPVPSAAPHAVDVHLERGDREPDHAVELVEHSGTNPLRDLGELEPVLDDDAQLYHETVRAQIDVDAFPDPPRHEAREPAPPCQRDHAVALGGRGADDLRDRVGRDGDAAALGRGDHERLALHRREPTTLDGLLDLAGFEAARADVRTGRATVEQHADALEVRVEAALRRDHGMAPAVAETRLLPADGADLRHERPRSVAVSAPQ